MAYQAARFTAYHPHVDKLPDYLAPGLRVVFCGTAASTRSADVGGYYAGPGNEFWGTLYQVGLIPVPLGPHLSARVLEFGIGLTDLAKRVARSSDRGLGSEFDVERFTEAMRRLSPRWIAFHGKTAGKVVSSALGHGARVALGVQSWTIGTSRVHVVPSMSGANRDPSKLEGKPSREAWFADLARVIGQ
jgi:TDG/mug DNA glycosylase family protein